MYKYFLFLHSIISGVRQDEFEEEEDKLIAEHLDPVESSGHTSMKNGESERSGIRTSLMTSFISATKRMIISQRKKKREVSTIEFLYIYNNKIKPFLETRNQMTFPEIHLLLSAYEHYQFEQKSKKTLF